MREFTVTGADSGMRLDKFMLRATWLTSPGVIYKYIRQKDIKVNGKRAQHDTRLEEGDVITAYMPDERFEKGTEDKAYLLCTLPLDILYEDENIIISDKRPGVLTCPDKDEEVETQIGAVLSYLYKKGEYKPGGQNGFTPAMCNRIDRNTGGIVLTAKNAAAKRILDEKIKAREIDKRYLCAALGIFKNRNGILQGYLDKDARENRVTVAETPAGMANPKPVKTGYRVICEKNGLSLLELKLYTGRTHQIRAQLAHIGHPLAGDTKYGKNSENKGNSYKYQALYAYRLTFSFTGDAGILGYLNGRTYTVKDVYFLDSFGEPAALLGSLGS